jgi:hypothetical protein
MSLKIQPLPGRFNKKGRPSAALFGGDHQAGLFYVAFAAFDRTGFFLLMATLTGLVRPILAEFFDLARALGVAGLAVLQQFLVLFVLEGDIAVPGREDNGVGGQGKTGGEEGKYCCCDDMLHVPVPFFGLLV